MLHINNKTTLSLKQKGFTLIEILIVIVISSIFLLALTQFFINTNQINTVQQKIADTQQSIRVAMEFMSRDIRMAGLNPNTAFPAPNAGFVNNGGGDETDQDSIAIRYDHDGDGACEFDVAYRYDNVNQLLQFRNGAAAAFQPLTESGTISSMSFSYILADGTNDPDPTTNGTLNQIRIVDITITGKITGAYSNIFNRTYQFDNRIKPRNLF
jgi:prepilin-type N-terminal cleavage/methylation domain-containing protein